MVMRLLATRGPQELWGDPDTGVGYINNNGVSGKPLQIQSILARGYWEEVDTSKSEQDLDSGTNRSS